MACLSFIIAHFVLARLPYVNEHVAADVSEWGTEFPGCAAALQSPIALNSTTAVLTRLPLLQSNYSVNPTPAVLTNTGTGLTVTFPNATYAVSGANLPNATFVLDSLRFHWSTNLSSGSEHSVDGVFFPLEIELIHRDSRFPTVSAASTTPGAVTIVSVLVQAFPANSSFSNGQLTALLDLMSTAAGNISAEGESASLNAFSLGRFISFTNTTSYFTYPYVPTSFTYDLLTSRDAILEAAY